MVITEFEMLEVIRNNIINALDILRDSTYMVEDFKIWLNGIYKEMQNQCLNSNNVYELVEDILRDLKSTHHKYLKKIIEAYLEELLEMEVCMFETDANRIREALNNLYDMEEIDNKLKSKLQL